MNPKLLESQEDGVFANTFRIQRDINGDYLLDFCRLSAEKDCAKVVARIRIRGKLLVDILQRIIAIARETLLPQEEEN